jgi:phosphoribosylglycinamide formyltransferase-1
MARLRTRLKTGVLISGRGSNLEALIAACRDPAFPAEIVIVIANKPDAPGLAFARAAGIPCLGLDHRAFADRAAFDAAVHDHLMAAGTEFICLAGYMRLLTGAFIERWRDRVINIHPSLLPAFRGLNAHAQAIAAGVKISGCTVHVVRHEMDAGPIIVQAAVPVLPDDTPESLAARVLAAEHRIYPLALRLVAEGRVRIAGDRAIVEGAVAEEGVLISPR